MTLREIDQSNFQDVARIYAEGLETGFATFETKVPSWDYWDDSHLTIGRIAAFETDKMLGWAALSPVSKRQVYKGVAEVSVYIGQDSRRRGVGQFLLKNLIQISESKGIWSLQSSIFPENKASILLHEKCGFRIIGYKEKIGQIRGKWHDNVLMERRSTVIGTA